MNIFKTAWKAIDIALAMSGLRLDAGRFLFAWVPLLMGAVWLVYQIEQAGLLVEYAIVSWVFYYGGISLILGTRLKRLMLERLGRETASGLYDTICGLMFFNIGCGVGAAAWHGMETVEIAAPLQWSLFWLCAVVGFGVKFWATWIVGVDTYYFRDLFLEQSHGEFSARGPYRWLANPMYGVGNLHLYCAPLYTESLFGLWFALGCHLSIYAFFLFIERPFIRRIYQPA